MRECSKFRTIWTDGRASKVCVTHLSVRVSERYGEVWVRHGPQNSHQRLDGVGVHHRPVLFEVFRGEATLVNDPGNKRKNVHQKQEKTRVWRNPINRAQKWKWKIQLSPHFVNKQFGWSIERIVRCCWNQSARRLQCKYCRCKLMPPTNAHSRPSVGRAKSNASEIRALSLLCCCCCPK